MIWLRIVGLLGMLYIYVGYGTLSHLFACWSLLVNRPGCFWARWSVLSREERAAECREWMPSEERCVSGYEGCRPKFGRMASFFYFYFVPWWWPVVVGRSCRMVVCFFYRSTFDVQRESGNQPSSFFFFCSKSNVQWVSGRQAKPNGHLFYCPKIDAESVLCFCCFFVLLVGKYLCYIIMSCYLLPTNISCLLESSAE